MSFPRSATAPASYNSEKEGGKKEREGERRRERRAVRDDKSGKGTRA